MLKDYLFRYLNYGKTFGVELETNDENYLGYVTITKMLVKTKVFELFKNEPDSPVLKEQILNKEKPFVVRICEFRADLLERNSYGTNEDYQRNEIFRFADLLEVGSFLAAPRRSATVAARAK